MLSVGEILKKAREEKKLTLRDIEKEIKVREKFLKAIENNDWSCFTSKIYIAGIIKNYSNILDLEPKKMLAFFRREYEKNEEVKFKKKISSRYLSPETKKAALAGSAGLILLFGLFFLYQLKIFLTPPKLDIISPKSSIFTKTDRVKIVGRTEKETAVTIRGERVYQNENGEFEYNFPLKPGKNQLTIEAVGANGKKTVITKEYTNNTK